MKKVLFFSILLLCIGNVSISQVVASVNFSGDTKIEPGVSNRVTVVVKNTQNVAIIKYKSSYVVALVYKGSTNAGAAFNKEVDLGDPLDPGKTRNITVNFTGPTLPGEYDVDVVLKWGGKIVSNIDKVTFVVAANYEVSLSAKATTFTLQRGGTKDIDLHFYVENTGSTAWPEGKYTLHFDVVSAPSGASKYDHDAFNISPKNVELWDLEPGAGDEFVYQDFKPPFTDGSYVVKVTLMLNGKEFDAEGNPKNLTFKMNVR